jgi:hypothetical protein
VRVTKLGKGFFCGILLLGFFGCMEKTSQENNLNQTVKNQNSDFRNMAKQKNKNPKVPIVGCMLLKKNKAQAGLEYLMTYGWALVIIVTVAGVLFFVMSPPAQGVSFSSSTRDFIVHSSNVGSGSGAAFTVQLQNASGKQVSITRVQSVDFVVSSPSGCEVACNVALPSGQIINLVGTVGGSYVESGSIVVSYTVDAYPRTLTLSAKGKIEGATGGTSGCTGPGDCPDNKCYEPACTSGTCSQTLVANGLTDEACYDNTGCGGGMGCYCDGVGNCNATIMP